MIRILVALALVSLFGAAAPTGPARRVDAAFAERTQALYARRATGPLERACAGATGEADLLCRYRLYPLTQRDALTTGLPETPAEPTARSYALLSGLWGYRAARAPITRLPRYGRRSEDVLRRARALDPTEPFVLLVEGQALLFKPAIFGGDRRAALGRFRALKAALARHPGSGIAPLEADLWIWYTLDRMGDRAAPALRARLLAAGPPPLYRDFLNHPPR